MDMTETVEYSLDILLEDFESECDNNLNIYFNALKLYNDHPDMFPEMMRDMVVEYVVLKLFGKWEEFLEEIFIEYMLGSRSEYGDPTHRYVNPVDKAHAYRMIQNVNLYPDWSDVEKILINARNFFENGGAFEVLKTIKADITSLKKVRNAIAHTSSRAKKDFENLVQGKIGYLPEGITPARFLIEFKVRRQRNAPTYCEYYISYLKDTAKILVQYHQSDVE